MSGLKEIVQTERINDFRALLSLVRAVPPGICSQRMRSNRVQAAWGSVSHP